MAVTCQTILYHSTIHWTCDMSLQKSFSRLRKKAKDKLSRIIDKTEKRRANVGDEEFNRSALSLQSEPGIVAEDELTGGIEVGVEQENLQPSDSQFVSHSAVEVGRDQSSDEADGGETSQKHLHPHSHIQTESGSSQGREDASEIRAGQAHPPTQSEVGNVVILTPSNLQGRESESA